MTKNLNEISSYFVVNGSSAILGSKDDMIFAHPFGI